jgi:hypothetical protein
MRRREHEQSGHMWKTSLLAEAERGSRTGRRQISAERARPCERHEPDTRGTRVRGDTTCAGCPCTACERWLRFTFPRPEPSPWRLQRARTVPRRARIRSVGSGRDGRIWARAETRNEWVDRACDVAVVCCGFDGTDERALKAAQAAGLRRAGSTWTAEGRTSVKREEREQTGRRDL